MSWEKSSYTAAGAALLSESLSGGALVITRAVSGTGTADADLSGETGVSGETHDLKLLDIETVESGGETARRVKIQITGADETYIIFVGEGRREEPLPVLQGAGVPLFG